MTYEGFGGKFFVIGYWKIFVASAGGRWILLPAFVSGAAGITVLLKGLGMTWLPDISYWALMFFVLLPISAWSIPALVRKVRVLQDQIDDDVLSQPKLYFDAPFVEKVQLFKNQESVVNIGTDDIVTLETQYLRVPSYKVNVASVSLHNKPIKKTRASKLNRAHITIEFYEKDTKQLFKKLEFGRWADNTQLGQHDSPSSVDKLRYRDIEPNDGANLINIALKYDYDNYCCAFNSESWLQPDLKEPKWVLNGDSFDVKIIIKSSNADDYESWFQLENLGQGNSLNITRK